MTDGTEKKKKKKRRAVSKLTLFNQGGRRSELVVIVEYICVYCVCMCITCKNALRMISVGEFGP